MCAGIPSVWFWDYSNTFCLGLAPGLFAGAKRGPSYEPWKRGSVDGCPTALCNRHGLGRIIAALSVVSRRFALPNTQ
jgi:hypothetical protein